MLLNSITELNKDYEPKIVLMSIAGAWAYLIFYLIYKWWKLRKEPKYQYVEYNDAGYRYWYIEEKHLFYYVPCSKTYKTEWEAVIECNELNGIKMKTDENN